MIEKISTKKNIGPQHVVNYLNENRLITVSAGETILEASWKADIRHPHVCGSNAK